MNSDPRRQTLAASRPAAAEPATSRVIVIVPCRNEEASVAKVVHEFLALTHVEQVLVVDNASTDQTAETARAAGARVIFESRPGKGYALLTGVREAGDADYYVMVDGDDTYPADQLPEMLAAADRGADMVVGTRLQSPDTGALRPGHTLGNRLFIQLVRLLFGLKTRDLFSGYRVMSRRYVQAVPLIATGFEIELELSLQALTHGFQIAEIPVSYRPRPEGSASKLRTFRDDRPMAFFGSLSLILLALSLTGGAVVILGFLKTGLVPRLPLAVLSAALFLLSALSLACGVLLSSINRRTAEIAALVRKRATRL